jgi:hypothetical protein
VKYKLDIQQTAEDFFEDTRILGIVAPVKDYQFCWQLNHALRLDFRINNDLEIKLSKKNRMYFFAIYEFAEPMGALRHYLYNNQFDGEFLLPEFKHLDFLWIAKGGEQKDEDWQSLQQELKKMDNIQLVTELPLLSIRNKQHLIF